MTGAMMQGAVADCFNRFPTLVKIAWTLFARHIRSIITETKINERYSIEAGAKVENLRASQHCMLETN